MSEYTPKSPRPRKPDQVPHPVQDSEDDEDPPTCPEFPRNWGDMKVKERKDITDKNPDIHYWSIDLVPTRLLHILFFIFDSMYVARGDDHQTDRRLKKRKDIQATHRLFMGDDDLRNFYTELIVAVLFDVVSVVHSTYTNAPHPTRIGIVVGTGDGHGDFYLSRP